MDLNELQKQMNKIMHAENHRPIPDFEGYSPVEIQQILYRTFEADSPIQLQKLTESDYKKIPMLNQIKYLCHLIDNAGELKLTKKGFLPVKIVAHLYHQGFLKDEDIETGISKLYKETDSITVHLPKILTELAKLTKKQKGKLSLTKASKKILSDDHELLRLILITFATKFNWSYFDGYGETEIGRLGCGFSMILLSKYGQKKRLDSFYAEKYFKAFPDLSKMPEPLHWRLKPDANNCYSIRTFDRFFWFDRY